MPLPHRIPDLSPVAPRFQLPAEPMRLRPPDRLRDGEPVGVLTDHVNQ
jgi:hypothetical protein